MMEKIGMLLSLAGLAVSWVWGSIYGVDLAWVAIVLCGIPIAWNAVQEVWKERQISSDLLVTMAIVAAVWIGETFAAGEVAFIMMVGMWLEHRTVAKASSALEGMVALVPETARVKRADEWVEVPMEQVNAGDRVLIRPGERIPVDGIVREGQAAVDQAALTGESLPVDKRFGDEVFVGTLNVNGVLEVEATRVGEETTFAKVTKLVAEALEKKAPVQRILDRFAAWIVPSSLVLAIIVYLFTGDPVRAVTILIVFCPCALVLATPTAIMAGIGSAAKHGILIKSGLALEQIGLVNAMLFDKTGTLTEGKLSVTGIARAVDEPSERVLGLAAALEQHSEHPLAKAIVQTAQERSIAVPEVEQFVVHVGSGVSGYVNGQAVHVGNRRLLAANGIALDALEEILNEKESTGQTGVLVAVDGQLIGLVALADQVRPEARETISRLHVGGVGRIAMLTGDNRGAAAHMAKQVGVTTVYAEQFPQSKYEKVEAYRSQGYIVGMVGDGINDAPALTAAHIGIAMGGGTQIAAQAADVVIMSDDVSKVADAVRLGRKTLRVIRENLLVSTIINAAAILLAIVGLLGPVAGAFVHNATSVLVVLNSARLIGYLRGKQSEAAGAVPPMPAQACETCTCQGDNCKLKLTV